jgi:hypothetical protein
MKWGYIATIGFFIAGAALLFVGIPIIGGATKKQIGKVVGMAGIALIGLVFVVIGGDMLNGGHGLTDALTSMYHSFVG